LTKISGLSGAFTGKIAGPYLGIILLALVLCGLFGYNGLYGQDSYEYVRYSKEWRTFFLHGTLPGDYFWPLLYPVLGGMIGILLPVQFALLLISVASLIASCFLLEKTINRQFGILPATSRIYVVLFLLLSPFMLRAALTDMSDLLATFFVTLGWYCFVVLLQAYSRKHLILFALAAAAAFMTRYACILLLLVPALILIYKTIRKLRGSDYLLILLIAGIVFSPHFLIRHTKPLAFLSQGWMNQWSPMNYFLNSFHNSNGHYQYQVQNIVYAFLSFFHPGFIFCGIALLFFRHQIQINNLVTKSLLLSIALYALFLAGIPFQNMRFIIPAFPLFLIFFFPVYPELVSKIKFDTRILILTIVCLQLALFARAFQPFFKANQTERIIAKACLTVPPGSIYTFSIDGALRFYGVELQKENLWDKQLETIQKKSYLLFNISAFEKEYAGRNPMLNYEFIRKHSLMHEMKQLPEGWTLYELR
jgi:hypothetical protein